MSRMRALVSRLRRERDPEEVVAISIWDAEDVRGQAEAMNVSMSKVEMEDVLEDMEHNHDAEFGLNWRSMEAAIERIIAKRPTPKPSSTSSRPSGS